MSFIWKHVSQITSSFVTGIVLGLPIYITVNDYIFSIARVEGSSMQPTLNPQGVNKSDLIFLDRWHVDPYDISRGDIVALTSPNNHQVSFIKRVIGIEGDIIDTPRYKHSFALIPRGHCWVEGDNSRSSLDSNKFGPISMGLIKGKATHVVWPPSRWTKLDQNVPDNRQPSVQIDRIKRRAKELNDSCLLVDEDKMKKITVETIEDIKTIEDNEDITTVSITDVR